MKKKKFFSFKLNIVKLLKKNNCFFNDYKKKKMKKLNFNLKIFFYYFFKV
jgi:hypothetical protein